MSAEKIRDILDLLRGVEQEMIENAEVSVDGHRSFVIATSSEKLERAYGLLESLVIE